MEQLDKEKYQIDTSDQDTSVDRYKYTAEARNIETEERKNTITDSRRSNKVKRADYLEMVFCGKKYGTQFINTEEK